MEMKNILTGVADRLSSLREERPSAGTRYRLMGVAADVAEVTEQLSKEVLERVKQEPVLDADVDVDFDALAEEVLSWELVATKEELLENTQMVNDALGGQTPCAINTEPPPAEMQRGGFFVAQIPRIFMLAVMAPQQHAQQLQHRPQPEEVAGIPR